MKTIDLSQLGGFPFTQDQLNYLQTAYTEAIEGLANSGNPTSVAWIISGCGVTSVPGSGTMVTYTITAGWLFYNGQMIKVPGNSITLDTSIDSAYIFIADTSGPLVYNDGSSHNVINDVSATLSAEPTGTADSSILFLLTELAPFGREANFTHVTVSQSGGAGSWAVNGDLWYKKNFIDNTITIHATLTATGTSHFAANPNTTFVGIATLGAAYRPVLDNVTFVIPTSTCAYTTGSGYFNNINGVLEGGGLLLLGFVNSPGIGGLGSYLATIDVILRLD